MDLIEGLSRPGLQATRPQNRPTQTYRAGLVPGLATSPLSGECHGIMVTERLGLALETTAHTTTVNLISTTDDEITL
ncbi:hypothetical protein V6N12_010222 [Hibiscus sabdariffa]